MVKREIILGTRKEFMDALRKLFITNYSEVHPGQNINDTFNIGYALNNWTMFFFWNKDQTIYTTVELIDDAVNSTKDSIYKDRTTVMKEYIDEQMKKLAMNIGDFSIDQIVIDKDGSECRITNKTINSIEVFIKKKTNAGVNSKQYFDMRSFNERFKVK